MKSRIKVKKEGGKIVYLIQIKNCLFWKSVVKVFSFEEAKEELAKLKELDMLNNTSKEKITFVGWMVRNQYTHGISNSLTVFSDFPSYKKSNDKTTIFWSGNEVASINTKTKLFGEVGLEPRGVKITIEPL